MTASNSKTTPKSSNEAGASENQLSFEQAYAELETIVAQMESAQMPLQASLAAYTRGNFLLQHCQQSLVKVEQQVLLLNGRNQLVSFTPVDD